MPCVFVKYLAILTGKGTSFIFQQCFAPKGLRKYNYFLILEQILKTYIMEIKIGDIVYLNSCPEIKFTTIHYAGDLFTIIGYSKDRQEFVTLKGIPELALTLVNNPSK